MSEANPCRLMAFLLIAICASGAVSWAQGLNLVAPATAQVLAQMTGAAGVVFAGEVVSVRRPAGYAGSPEDMDEGIVAIEFRVDQAVRGCTSGSVYTLREWAGLWTGVDRYRIGQRLLVFLHSPNAIGLSSTVHGSQGAIPLRGGGIAPGPYDVSTAPADWLVDLRWVEAQVPREAIEAVSGPVGRPIGRPVSEEVAADAPDAFGAENTTGKTAQPELLPTRSGYPHWTALPRASDRSMPLLAQVLSLCREWVNAPPGHETITRSSDISALRPSDRTALRSTGRSAPLGSGRARLDDVP